MTVRFIRRKLMYAHEPMGSGNSWAEPRDHMSPAYPRSMHICFHVRDDVDFNKFIHDLETESARRGMTVLLVLAVIGPASVPSPSRP